MNHRGLLAILFVGAFGLRLAFCAFRGLDTEPPLHGDESEYVRYARNLAQGKGYVGLEPGSKGEVASAYLPPGTPAFYAGVFTVFGPSLRAVRIAQCILSAASALFLFQIARAVFGNTCAWIASIIFALYPMALLMSHDLMTETLYVFLLLIFTWISVVKLAPTPSWMMAAAAGLTLGLAMLTRPAILFFMPMFAVWFLLSMPTWRARGMIAIVALGAVLVVTPWSIHASGIYGKFVLVSPTAWTVFIQGNNRIVATDPLYAGYCVWYTDIPEYAHQFDGLNQVQREQVAKELVLRWLGENKDKWSTLVINKAARFWTPLLKQPNKLERYTMLLCWGGMLVLFVPAFVVSLPMFLRRRSPGLWFHLFILTTFCQALIYFALPRYRFPMEPFCMIFAGKSVAVLLESWRSRSTVGVGNGLSANRQSIASTR